MNTRLIFPALAGLTFLLGGCSTSKKTTNQSTRPSSVPVCSNNAKDSLQLEWYKVNNPLQSDVPTYTLPTHFNTYAISTDRQLKAFFIKAKTTAAPFSMPLSGPDDCRAFTTQVSGTMSAELAAKYPEIVSLKGRSDANADADLRLDYDGNQMRGQIIWSGKVYIIDPVKYGNSTVYIVYDKNDTSVPKNSFESDPTKQQQPQKKDQPKYNTKPKYDANY
ncbi:hypothetical protein [Taibaiella soli]|uniref:Lipoprotein n=1 Tax=Taibaiella soli TaxID=1649169 RepID=A0A2W2B4N1_9BACT|nr:hypothetical protein [Taibaiella soli]PZF75028.1 hypothetical protein DN068_00295 [Taibaiella soli]